MRKTFVAFILLIVALSTSTTPLVSQTSNNPRDYIVDTTPADGDIMPIWKATPITTKSVSILTLKTILTPTARVITCTPPLLCEGGASMTLAADRTLSIRLPVIFAADYGVSSAASAATNSTGLASAIAALPASGGIVQMPCGDPIDISSQLTLGNASSTNKSTRNGITLRGCGIGSDAINFGTSISSATRLRWTGAAGATMVKFNGPVEGIVLEDFTLDGNSLAATGLHALRAFNLSVKRLQIMRWTGTAIKSDANSSYSGVDGAGGAPMMQLWEMVQTVDPAVNTANGFDLGAFDISVGNTNEITFSRCTFERGDTDNAWSLRLGYVDHVSFEGTFFLRRGSTTGRGIVVASPPGFTTFPANITFHSSPLIGGVYEDTTAATWTGTIPALLFFPYYTADSQAVPPVGATATTLNPVLVGGFTDFGLPLSGSQQASLASAPGLSANQVEFGLNGILFNGSTPDSNQTFLTVADPTADRSITIPNISGTVVTTGDTGSVSDGMLASSYSGVGACGANTWASTLNDNAAPTCTQPNYSNITGDLVSLSNGSGLLRIATSGGTSQIQSGITLSGGSAAPIRFGSIFLSNLWLDISTSGNIGIGTSSYGTSAAGVFAIKNGTAPTSSPADTVQLWAADTAAGDANLYARNEAGRVEQLTGLNRRNAAQFDVTSSTTLVNVTGLTFNVEAGKSYGFTAWLPTTSDVASGIKFAVSGTATATSIIYEGTDGLSSKTRVTSLGSTVCAFTAVTTETCNIRGTIVVNAAGTLTIQFAQNISGGVASSVLANSTFYLYPIGD